VIDPTKHPFSAALYNKPERREKRVPHEWGGNGKEEYVGKHRKGGCAVVALLILGLSGSVGAALVEWLA
jgi:hypothetical protein